MTSLLAHSGLTLRRDRNLIDATADAALDNEFFLHSYVVEAGDGAVLRATTSSSLSQGLKDAFTQTFLGNTFGGVSLVLLDAQDQPLLQVRREAGLTGAVVFSRPAGELLWKTSHQGQAWLSLLDQSGQAVLTIEREGTLYPTYPCSAGGVQVGTVDAKFNGLAELFNKTNRYELSFTSQATEEQRLAVVAVGLVVDLQFGGNT